MKDINRNTIKLLQKKILLTNCTVLLILLGASVLWKCYRVMTEESTVMLINCQQKHIFCSCSPALEVPIEDRAYVKDQRLKKSPKDFYQMTSEDRVAVKRALRSSASFLRSTVDSSSFPCTSIQSSTDTNSASVHSEVSFNKQYVAMTASDTKIMPSH